MTEVLFYHLQHQPLEAVLPTLLQKTLERGWRAVVQVTTEERMSALDDHLWTFADESFLPHGTDREAHAADQPILITLSGENPNGASIRFLLEGADLPSEIASYERLAILFDGNDLQAATTRPIGSRTSAGAGSGRREAFASMTLRIAS
jgi:DNA polymerase-3 subunit chi